MRSPPRFLFVQINQRCNLRCGHCVYWTCNDDDMANYLAWPRRREILQEFADLNPRGTVVIAGGEPMLDLDEYFAVTTACRALGLRTLSVVNGTRIRSAEFAARVIRDGPDEISISLNSHVPAIHDATRGVRGAFAKAVGALRLLVAARRQDSSRRTRIYVMGLVFDENYRDLDGFYDFVLNDVGADKLKLNFLQPSFGNGGDDPFFAAHSKVDPEVLGSTLAACDAKFHLGLNPVWMEQVKMYFRSLSAGSDLIRGWASATKTSEHICNTYDRNITIDHYGTARLCFSNGFRGERLQRYGDLRAFWDQSEDIREKMRSCNQFCGISHSVRRETATLASRGATVDLPPPAAAAGSLSSLWRRINGV